ncbi:MAG: elongation factor Ts [Clostridia bacterium]|nr:elongation factor Ts [Clostridia bacterium]
MAAITAKDVAALRAQTGCGMMDCKKALVEADGNFDEAVKVLREKGLAKADAKQSRIAAEGLVDILSCKECGLTAMIEVNTETDFVAKNDGFKAFVKSVLKTILKNKPADVEALLACTLDGSDVTVEAEVKNQTFVIGEKITIRRFVVVEGPVGTYIHGAGATGIVISFDADEAVANNEKFAEVGKNIGMQAAAMNCLYTNREDVPASVLEEEKKILLAQISNDPKNANKPDAIKEKMVVGRINKYYETNCLAEQAYVKDEDLSVTQYLDAEAKEMGGSIKLKAFYRYEKGEGLEKREDNFAEEIASMLK